MHTVLVCLVCFILYYQFLCIRVNVLPILCRVTSLVVEKLHDCLSTIEEILSYLKSWLWHCDPCWIYHFAGTLTIFYHGLCRVNSIIFAKYNTYPYFFLLCVQPHASQYTSGHSWFQRCLGRLVPRPRGLIRPYMMTSSNGNIFRVTGHLCGEFTGLRWSPHTKASDAELWCLLWSTSE